ncbi:MAG: UDP-N-acetylmuramoyl-tripeptide--D-alanyl-D-alanine ligase [Pseudomonadota bacterium]
MSSERPLWQAEEAAAATSGKAEGFATLHGISIDTREIAPGDLFVALQGEARDGHAFVAEALAKGAAAAMVTHRPEGVGADAPLLTVSDTLAGLCGLAATARARTKAKVVGVTGSVGKTTTKEMLRAMLGEGARVHAAERSFNNHWGVPLTLARLPAETDYAVIEIGMNHAGEIEPLSRLTRPHVGLVTTVEAVHLEFFASVKAIARAKAEIFAGIEAGGTAVLNADNPHTPILVEAARRAGARVVRFGEAEGAEVRLTEIALGPDTTALSLDLHGTPVLLRVAAPGRHLAANAAAALAAAQAAGHDPARAALGLGRWSPPQGRGVRERVILGEAGIDGTLTLIDDSFNASPASVRAGLEVLAAIPVEHHIGRIARGRRLAFLGDMLELGAAEADLHAGLAALDEMAAIDTVHTCGARMRALHDALPPAKRGEWHPDSAALAERAPRLVDAGDVCLVKGSKGSRMGPVVAAIRALGHPAKEDA